MKVLILLFFGLILVVESLAAQHERTEYWHMRTSLFKDQLTTVPKNAVIFLGNSITEGFNLRHYFPVSKPVNRGINGDHIDGLIERLNFSVIDLQPSLLFIMIGINDIGAGASDTTILASYGELLDRLTHSLPETEIFVHSILPTRPEWSNCPKEKIIRLNTEIEKYVHSSGLKWIDLYSDFVDASGYLNNKYTSDGLHLNAAGYQRWQSILNEIGLE